MAGYSGTPLPKKLGMLPGTVVFFDGGSLDIPGITCAKRLGEDVDIVHLFTKSAAEMGNKLADYRKRLRDDATVWVSWPKKASKVPTDITEDVIREICLPMGWVDVKVCAVDDTWSGLKLVVRKELRAR
ncbi:MAG: DUF3052 family protein [Acidobacteriota bacterium]